MGGVIHHDPPRVQCQFRALISAQILIKEEKRRAAGLELTGDDFHKFAKCRLTPEVIGRSPEYEFFRSFLKESLSRTDRHSDRWLHAVVTAMKQIIHEDPVTMSCSLDRFRQFVEQGTHVHSHIDATDLARTAADANFLLLQGDRIRPCIPLLERRTVGWRTAYGLQRRTG